ncbi:MAG: metallopeptidase TldD-related protein [Ilumatobacteraceae bacterium]
MSGELELAAQVLERVRAADAGAEIQVTVDRNRLALTRFANSVIHQNVAEDTLGVSITIHRDGRTISASSTVADESGFQALVERTVAAARLAPRDPAWPGLAPPDDAATAEPPDPATANASPEDRAARVKAFVDAASGLETAGYCRTNHWTGALVNSAGQSVTGESADAGLAGIARRSGNDGVARAASGRLADIDGAVLGARAAAKADAAIDPVEIPPARYEVVLEPTAVADILEAFSMYGFNAKAVAERRSFVRVGEAQFDATVHLVDDAPATGSSFDAEGTPRRRLVLVDGGTTTALTHDRRTAAEAGTTSTGHGVGSASFGAFARHLTLLGRDPAASGAAEVEGPVVDDAAAELVAGVERGVLVTDFWYTRVLDPRSLALTGLTRNGVWLIERGEVTTPLRNFRFTQAYAQALMPGAVLAVGRVAAPMPGDTYSASTPRWTAPALHLASWNFTGGASG